MKLNKSNIICFCPSRLIKSGKINKIIFNKTETLSSNNLKIYGYYPVLDNINSNKNLIFKNHSKNQCKDLNKSLYEYYKNYLYKNNNKTQLLTVLF